MVKIPTVSPGTTQLTTRSATAPRTSGTRGKELQIAGQVIEKTASFLYQKMDKARNYTEATQAELFTNSKNADLLIYQDTDTYTDPSGRIRLRTGRKEDYAYYDEQIRKNREEVGKFFSNKEQQAKFMAEYDKSALITRNQITNTFMKNMVSEGQVATLEAIDGLSDTYAMSGDKNILKQIEATIDGATAQGFFNPKEAYNLKKKNTDNAKWKLFLNDFMFDPDQTEKDLRSNKYGLST